MEAEGFMANVVHVTAGAGPALEATTDLIVFKGAAGQGIRSLMSVPLRVHGVVTGTLAYYFRSPHRFVESEVRVATALSNLAGSAIGTWIEQDLLSNDTAQRSTYTTQLAGSST